MDKSKYVKNIFQDIAPEYDLINNIITLGIIQRWRKQILNVIDLKKNDTVLDLCAGTGELTELLAKNISSKGKITGIDFCPKMVDKARKKFNGKYSERVEFQIGNAESLEFKNNFFNHAVIAFGLRNVDNISRVLKEMKRVVKPGGMVISLDLAKPEIYIFKQIYYLYFNHFIPVIGKLIHGKKEPYIYLKNSLKNYLNQEELKNKFIQLGLKKVDYIELTLGIAVIHRGIK